MTPKSPLPWFLNGESNLGYRIDCASERVGLDFLNHPTAIVPELEDARFLVEAVEHYAQKPREALLREAIGLVEMAQYSRVEDRADFLARARAALGLAPGE